MIFAPKHTPDSISTRPVTRYAFFESLRNSMSCINPCHGEPYVALRAMILTTLHTSRFQHMMNSHNAVKRLFLLSGGQAAVQACCSDALAESAGLTSTLNRADSVLDTEQTESHEGWSLLSLLSSCGQNGPWQAWRYSHVQDLHPTSAYCSSKQTTKESVSSSATNVRPHSLVCV